MSDKALKAFILAIFLQLSNIQTVTQTPLIPLFIRALTQNPWMMVKIAPKPLLRLEGDGKSYYKSVAQTNSCK